jgi:predicted dehydrogenase
MPRRHVVRPPGCEPDAPGPLVATGRPLCWGVVATGSIARTVSAELAQLEDAELHAVSSRNQARASAFCEEMGFDVAYGDARGVPGYQRLADDPDVEVVYVATPHGQHHEVVRALLEAGKHVLVEKSFTIHAREADDLVALARERGRFLMEAVATRFLPAYQRALDIVASGEIGEVRYVQADLGFPAVGDPRERLWAPEDGGGALLDLTVYPFTWAFGALGLPRGLLAVGALNDDGVDELNALTLVYEQGAHAQLTSTFVSHAARTATIAGSEGTLRTAGRLTNPEAFTVVSAHGSREERFAQGGPRYAYELREVTRCVQEGLLESPTMPLADTLATLRLFDEARRQMGVRYPHDAQWDALATAAD